MYSSNVVLCILLAGFIVSASTLPGQLPAADPVVAPNPLITPPPTLVELPPTRTYKVRRNIISNLESRVSSALGALGSNIPSFVASGQSVLSSRMSWQPY
jgi:hypothetical protein